MDSLESLAAKADAEQFKAQQRASKKPEPSPMVSVVGREDGVLLVNRGGVIQPAMNNTTAGLGIGESVAQGEGTYLEVISPEPFAPQFPVVPMVVQRRRGSTQINVQIRWLLERFAPDATPITSGNAATAPGYDLDTTVDFWVGGFDRYVDENGNTVIPEPVRAISIPKYWPSCELDPDPDGGGSTTTPPGLPSGVSAYRLIFVDSSGRPFRMTVPAGTTWGDWFKWEYWYDRNFGSCTLPATRFTDVGSASDGSDRTFCRRPAHVAQYQLETVFSTESVSSIQGLAEGGGFLSSWTGATWVTTGGGIRGIGINLNPGGWKLTLAYAKDLSQAETPAVPGNLPGGPGEEPPVPPDPGRPNEWRSVLSMDEEGNTYVFVAHKIPCTNPSSYAKAVLVKISPRGNVLVSSEISETNFRRFLMDTDYDPENGLTNPQLDVDPCLLEFAPFLKKAWDEIPGERAEEEQWNKTAGVIIKTNAMPSLGSIDFDYFAFPAEIVPLLPGNINDCNQGDGLFLALPLPGHPGWLSSLSSDRQSNMIQAIASIYRTTQDALASGTNPVVKAAAQPSAIATAVQKRINSLKKSFFTNF